MKCNLIVFQISHNATFYATELLSWEKSDKYRNELPYELSFLSFWQMFILVWQDNIYSKKASKQNASKRCIFASTKVISIVLLFSSWYYFWNVKSLYWHNIRSFAGPWQLEFRATDQLSKRHCISGQNFIGNRTKRFMLTCSNSPHKNPPLFARVQP